MNLYIKVHWVRNTDHRLKSPRETCYHYIEVVEHQGLKFIHSYDAPNHVEYVTSHLPHLVVFVILRTQRHVLVTCVLVITTRDQYCDYSMFSGCCALTIQVRRSNSHMGLTFRSLRRRMERTPHVITAVLLRNKHVESPLIAKEVPDTFPITNGRCSTGHTLDAAKSSDQGSGCIMWTKW